MRKINLLARVFVLVTPFVVACAQDGNHGGLTGASGGAGGSGGSSITPVGGATSGGAGGSGGSSVDDAGESGGADSARGDVPDPALCDRLSVEAELRFESYLDSQPMPCQSAADCIVDNFATLDCFLSCGFLMGAADRARVSAAAASICDAYFAAGCPKMLPLLCPAGFGPELACSQGRCGGIPPVRDGGVGLDGATSG